jgi:site-specific DNA-methyltransferase (adenine-specific)
MLTITNEDNMALMARYPDKYFDLAIVDPPYGIGASEMTMGSGKNKKYKKGKKWDSETPKENYFNELKRITKNQIIWGGNYFNLQLTKSWIFWDKGINGDCDFADGELAWTSFNKVLRIAPIRYKGFLGADNERIHPTQKPVALYKWLLDKYAKIKCDHKHEEHYRHLCTDCRNSNVKILDTHLGSGSIAIACHDYGFDLTACELDKEYFDAAMKRINNHMAQTKLF